MTEYWVLRQEGHRPLTVNKIAQQHRMAWAKQTARIRHDWQAIARQHVPPIPRLRAVSITVTPLHKDRRSPQDVSACSPEAKAAIDGLVDYGMFEDDRAEFVHSITFLPPVVCGVDGMEIEITEVLT